MKCNIIQNQTKQLQSKLNTISKPTTDVWNYLKTIVYLGTGQILSDWEKLKQFFEIAINRITSRNMDKNWLIYCEKQILKPQNKITILGNELHQLLINCINYIKEETISQRSKSRQEKVNKNIENNHASTSTRIGALVKFYKVEYQKMMYSRPSLKSKLAEERENKHVEQIKEKIKRSNKNSFFISPKREQQEKAKSSNK